MNVILIINQSTAAQDDTILDISAALQAQIDEDFCPFWGIAASLQFIPGNTDSQALRWLQRAALCTVSRPLRRVASRSDALRSDVAHRLRNDMRACDGHRSLPPRHRRETDHSPLRCYSPSDVEVFW
jgi:hypothetical protein